MKTLNQKISLLFVLSFTIILAIGCKKDGPDEQLDPTGFGYVNGTVTTPSGKVVPGAKVCIAEAENDYFTYTNTEGNFTLKAPVGQNTLRIYTGSGNIFNTEVPVTVTDNQTITLPPAQSVLLQERSIAYLYGDYDYIQHIVIDSLGFQATQIDYNDLQNLGTLQQYDLVLLNCGTHYGMVQNFQPLEDYVTQGGNLYASDYAIQLLVGDDILKTSGHSHNGHTHSPKTQVPCASTFTGGFVEDSLLCYSKSGPMQISVAAQVTSSALQQIIGSNVQLFFDLDMWTVLHHVELIDPRFEELIHDPAVYGTLAVKMDWNQGQAGGYITYTSFHNEANATPDMLNFLEWVILHY